MVAIITPYTRGAGYLRSDDQPSGGKFKQADIQTCWHCQKILDMQLHAQDGAICGVRTGCRRPICHFCAIEVARTGRCVPFHKWLEQAVEAEERRAQLLRNSV